MAAKRTAMKKAPAKKAAPSRRSTGGRSSSGADVFDFSKRMQNEEYVTPFILFLVALPVMAGVVRSLVGLADSRMLSLLVAAGLFLTGGGLTVVILDEASPRARWVKVRAALTVAWIHAAVVLTLAWPGPKPLFVIVGVGFELAMWWAVSAHSSVRGDGRDAHGRGDSLAEALGLGDSDVTKVEDDESGVRRTIKMRLKGVSIDALTSAQDLIATRARVPRTGVRVVENPDDASTPNLVLVRKDVLRRMPPWPGPSRPGASIAEPVRCGLREDGSDLEAIRPGRHTLQGGMTGAGKTEGSLTEFADIITRNDVVIFWSDTAKPGQTFPDIAPAVARVATTQAGTKKLVAGLQKAVNYRSTKLKGRTWTPSWRMPAIGVHFEEARFVTESLGTALVDFVATARSVGIFITLSTQRPSANALDTDARAQFADTWCFGVSRDEDAAMVLTDGVIEKGARPEVWGDKRPGYCYREAGPEEKHAMPARTWQILPAVLRRHVAEWAPRMAQLDSGTAEAMGGAWTELTSGADYAVAHGWHRTDTGGWTPPAGDDDTTDQEEDHVDDTMSTPAEHHVPTPRGDEHDTTDDTDIDEELAAIRAEADEEYPPDEEIIPALIEAARLGDDEDPVDVPLGDVDLWLGESGPKLDRRARVIAFATVLAELVPADPDGATVQTDDLVAAVLDVPGFGTPSAGRPAMYRMIDRLEGAGEAEDRGRGTWWFAPTAPGWLRRELANATDSDGSDELDEVLA